MNLPVISLLALAIAVTLSCTTKINVGVLSMALAWIIGVYLAQRLFAEIAGGFPTTLFLTLVGVTLLFTQAKVNGTLDKVANRAVRSCRGSLPLIPVMFFFLACLFGSIGPGSIASAALIGPMAMTVAAQTGIPAFLMAIMVANGANSASLSPIGPTGIIVWRFFRSSTLHREVDVDQLAVAPGAKVPNGDLPEADRPFQWRHWLTLGVIVMLVVGVIFLGVNVGMGALAGAVILVLANATKLFRQMLAWGMSMAVVGAIGSYVVFGLLWG